MLANVMIFKARSIFISHSSADIKLVENLHTALRKKGLRPFVSSDLKNGLKPGDEWKKELYKELRETDSVLLVISQNWIDSKYCEAEHRIAKRQADEQRAVEISELAKKAGFEFWLDVLDPTLQVANQTMPAVQQALAIAGIIEMAMLNCSHVIALITKNSAGSTWIPYEYGRVKVGKVWSQEACCWVESTKKASEYYDQATYLQLGHTTKSDSQIKSWFHHEKAKWPPEVPPPSLVGRVPRLGAFLPPSKFL